MTHAGDAKLTCLLTIHGIGFQQQPIPDQNIPGYADGLHAHLRENLRDTLSDDPGGDMLGTGPGPGSAAGPVYVQSSYPPDTKQQAPRSIEAGLRRLGHRPDPRSDELEAPLPALRQNPTQRIVHVALIYTPAEAIGPQVGAGFETAVQGIMSVEHYTRFWRGLEQIGQDLVTVIHPPQVDVPPPGEASNRPRRDPVHGEGVVRRVLEHLHKDQPGAHGVLRTVEDDVAAYVARNQVRERVRDFVREALIRLAHRGDVEHIVINSHSNGTTIALDSLRTLPFDVVDRVAAYFTLGSPLRKYVQGLNWGHDVGHASAIQTWNHPEPLGWHRTGNDPIPAWTNMWDPLDPVADPLVPGPEWRRGDPRPADDANLFIDVDAETGQKKPHPIEDIEVDNVHHVGGAGLRAHDYWSNTREVVPRIADRLRALADAAVRA